MNENYKDPNTNINASISDISENSEKEFTTVAIARPFLRGNENNLSSTSGSYERTGWYYDSQLKDPLTSIGLYANSILVTVDKNTGEKRWVDAENKAYEYWLCNSILAEDFSVDVSNSWTDFGGDMIGEAVNSVIKPFAPYASLVGKYIHEMHLKQDNLPKEVTDDSLFGRIATKAVKLLDTPVGDESTGVRNLVSDMGRVMNRSLVTQGCSFTTYGGTGVGFNNLGMKFTLFPDFVNGKWTSVPEQVLRLLPYIIGELENVDWDALNRGAKGIQELAGEVKDYIGNAFGKSTANTSETSSGSEKKAGEEKTTPDIVNAEKAKVLNDYIKWQMPPGGFRIDEPKNLDVESFPGTLQLRIGTNYTIDNLVIANASLQFSKQMVKNPVSFSNIQSTPTSLDTAVTPLYCDVSLLFKPTTKYSAKSLRKFINSNLKEDAARIMLNNLKNATEKTSGSYIK